MKKLIVLLLVSSVLFAACKSEKQKEGIKKTEEMLVKVDSIKAELTSPEVEAYKKIYDTTKVYISYFEHLPANFERTVITSYSIHYTKLYDITDNSDLHI